MAIETLGDYNAQASCCCQQTPCPIPDEICESMSATYRPSPLLFDGGIYYNSANENVIWVDADGIQQVNSGPPDFNITYGVFPRTLRGWSLEDGPCGEVDQEQSFDDFFEAEEPGYLSITSTFQDTPSNPWTEATFTSDILTNFATFTFPLGCSAGSSCESSITGTLDTPSLDYPVLTLARQRWQIPAEWTDPVTGLTVAFPGTYFKITYDIINEPDGWDDPSPTVFRSFVSEDNVLIWTGPGSGDQSDPSWLTDWVDIPMVTGKGRNRIVNRRLVCREGWGLGVLPQVWGEAVTLPDP